MENRNRRTSEGCGRDRRGHRPAASPKRAGAGRGHRRLGGDCTVGIGTVAGHRGHRGAGGPRLLRPPRRPQRPRQRAPPGAPDWMGRRPQARGSPARGPSSSALGPPSTPLLEPEQARAGRMGARRGSAGRTRRRSSASTSKRWTVDEVRADPEGAAARALEGIQGRVDRLVVHFDVDVIDFTDTPLSENPGRTRESPTTTRCGRSRCCSARRRASPG